MLPKLLNIEIILIYFLLLIPWPHTQVIKLLCSKDSSRLVRKIVRSKWSPILDKHQVKLPLECPLHPFRDLFAPRQNAKQRDRPTQWTCRRCGKSFYQEKFLDLHFETRHKYLINEAEDSICIADFCDIMRCDVFQSEESSSLKTSDQHIVTDIEVWGDSLGQNSALAKSNSAYLSLIPLRTSSVGASRAAKVQNRQLCNDKMGQTKLRDSADDAINTSDNSNNINDSGGSGSSASIIASSSGSAAGFKSKSIKTAAGGAAADEADGANGKPRQNHSKTATKDYENITTTAERQENGNSSANHLQKARANCKPEELSRLKAKCEYLVRSCIGGLILSMTDQAFKEMEEEMNKAVCWYLSCDRYWEDGPLEPRAFPWVLIVILIFVLSTGICFCYYIIWILFDSEEATINANNHHSIYMQQQQQQHLMHQQQQQFYQPHQYPMIDDYATNAMAHMLPQHQQHYPHYYQQPQQHAAQAHDIYPEQVPYDPYRHSPRHRYIDDQRQPGTPPTSISGGRTTPQHHTTSHAYPQDILDRRDYISRPIAASMPRENLVGAGAVGGISGSSLHLSAASDASDMGGMLPKPQLQQQHYSTHPRQLTSHHRHVGSSQQSLRSSSTHDIVQNEIGHNEHYIYVTYPPDLKKRYFEKYE